MKCFLDLDGVIVDWTYSIYSYLGAEQPSDIDNWNYLDQHLGKKTVDRVCNDIYFWENTCKTKEADQIIKLVKKYYFTKIMEQGERS